MGLLYGRLTHDSTYPSGAKIDFRHLGVLIASAYTDANGYYAIILDATTYTAKVGVDLCTPNPVIVYPTSTLQDLLQAKDVPGGEEPPEPDKTCCAKCSAVAVDQPKRIYFFSPDDGTTPTPAALSGLHDPSKYWYLLHLVRGSLKSSWGGEAENEKPFEDNVLIVACLQDDVMPVIKDWHCTNP